MNCGWVLLIGVKFWQINMKYKCRCLVRWLIVIFIFAISTLFVSTSNVLSDNSINSLENLTRWDEFNFVSWEIKSLFERFSAATISIEHYLSDEQQAELVLRYLEQVGIVERLETELETSSFDPSIAFDPEGRQRSQAILEEETKRMHSYGRLAESILQNQTERSLIEFGFGLGGQIFPPVLFKISDLPLNLIISPRDKIGTIKTFSLNPGMNAVEKDQLENRIYEQFDLSALVEPVGGLGAYPTMVMRSRNLDWLTEVVAHEWIHNYLTFYPLGMRYFHNNDLRTMNETLANLAGKEIGRRTMIKYYPRLVRLYYFPGRQASTVQFDVTTKPFIYRHEMRETRYVVDYLLAEGQIDRAEAYMEARRQFFWENGYHLRKINQAYFAFYGSYNDTPGGGAAGSDPIGPAVQSLRARSTNLKQFIDQMKYLKSFDELQAELQ